MMITRDVQDMIGSQQKIRLVILLLKDLSDQTLFRFRSLHLEMPMSSLSNAKYIFVKMDPTLAILILQTACRLKLEFHLLEEDAEALQLLKMVKICQFYP